MQQPAAPDDPPGTSAAGFGAAVRARRGELAITLEQLAAASGVSRGTLSRIENQALSTSLDNAVAISSALGVELSDLVEGVRTTLVPAGEATAYTDPQGIIRTSFARPAPGMELIEFRVPAGSRSQDFAPHQGRTTETMHILSGRLTYGVADEAYELGPGDTLVARADERHWFSNPGRDLCVMLVIIASPR